MTIDTNNPEFQAGLLAFIDQPEVVRDTIKGRFRDDLASARAKLLAFVNAYEAAKPSPWQPIETAPAHTPILMLMKHGAIEGHWCPEEGVGYGYYWADLTWFPTHWQPLPQPPTRAPKESV